MKKVFFTLILIMMASPAWATIYITATDLGDGMVAIEYSGTELARAFALDITVDNGIIAGITDYVIGDDNNGYGIFPANFSRHITVLDTGEVETWDVNDYTPIANPNDPGALGGLGTNGITIEMGSLYDTQAPPMQGRLCTVLCTAPCLLSVTTNATRGNVVLEDATEAEVDLTGATDVIVSAGITIEFTSADLQQWEAVGKPDCWLASINPRQCHGDADGLAEGEDNFWVSDNDLDILIGALNKPLSELEGNQICADFDHLPQGSQQYRVSANDFEILMAHYKIANGPSPDCP